MLPLVRRAERVTGGVTLAARCYEGESALAYAPVAALLRAALGALDRAGRLGELPGTVTDTPRPHLPTGVVTGDDLRGLRFAVVPRGYSMDQVDELLDRLARQLDAGPADRPAAGQPDRAFQPGNVTLSGGSTNGRPDPETANVFVDPIGPLVLTAAIGDVPPVLLAGASMYVLRWMEP